MSTQFATDYANEYAYVFTLEVEGIGNCGDFDGDGIEWGVESNVVNDPQFGEEANGGRQTTAEAEISRPMRRSGRPTLGNDSRFYQEFLRLGGRARVTLKQFEKDDFDVKVFPPLGVYQGVLGPTTGPSGSAEGTDPGRLSVTVRVKR